MLLLTVALAPVLIDPANCLQQSRWQTDGRGGLSVSTDARFTGEVLLRCRVEFPSAVAAVAVDVERVRVAFTPAAAEGGRSGLIIEIDRRKLEYVQVTREDWIEASDRSWRVELRRPGKSVEVVVRAVDDSPAMSMRIDLRRLRIGPAE